MKRMEGGREGGEKQNHRELRMHGVSFQRVESFKRVP